MNCYELTLEFIRILNDLEVFLNKKSTANEKDQQWLDTRINDLESRMLEIKKVLKSKEV